MKDATEQVGAKLRDAAVDPRPTDLLPPSNAGQANPHGPAVVAYEVDSPERVAAVAAWRREHNLPNGLVA